LKIDRVATFQKYRRSAFAIITVSTVQSTSITEVGEAYLKAKPSKMGVRESLKVWQSDRAESNRPAWTSRATISPADALPTPDKRHTLTRASRARLTTFQLEGGLANSA
jgi:hypothetical protein